MQTCPGATVVPISVRLGGTYDCAKVRINGQGDSALQGVCNFSQLPAGYGILQVFVAVVPC